MSQLNTAATAALLNEMEAVGKFKKRQRTTNRRVNTARGLGIGIPPMLVEAATSGGPALTDPRVQASRDFIDDEIARARGGQPLVAREHDRDRLFGQSFSDDDRRLQEAQVAAATRHRETLQRSTVEGLRRQNIGEVPGERIEQTRGRATVGAAQAAADVERAKSEGALKIAGLESETLRDVTRTTQEGETGRTAATIQSQERLPGIQTKEDIRLMGATREEQARLAMLERDPQVRSTAKTEQLFEVAKRAGAGTFTIVKAELFSDTIAAIEREMREALAEGDTDTADTIRGKLLTFLDQQVSAMGPMHSTLRFGMGVLDKNRLGAQEAAKAMRDRLLRQ